MGLFDSLNKGDIFSGFFGTDNLKDYSHGSKLMRSDAFALAPTQKFLFHVYFTLGPGINNTSSDSGLIGALVKTVTLPSFDLDTQEYIQYNRKRNIHNRISYRPVDIKMHDDSSDTIRSLWHNYYSYYFADTDYQYAGDTNATGPAGNGIAYTGRNIYDETRVHNNWGITTKNSRGIVKPAFFKDIKIYGFSRGNYVLYTLVNPMITSWMHDTYDYAQTDGVMEHTMSVKYEAVKYDKGKVSDGVLGFAEPSRYDTTPGALSKPGSTASIFGQSGLLDTITGSASDLSSGNILGAIKKVGTQALSLSNSKLDLSDILKADINTEINNQLPKIINNASKNAKNLFVKPPVNPKPSVSNTAAKPPARYTADPDPTGSRRAAIEKAQGK